MNAAEIIEEIKVMPPDERAKVVEFVKETERSGKLSGKELGELAKSMIRESDPEEKKAIKEKIVSGFYGD